MPKQPSTRAPSEVCVVYCRVSSERQAKEDKGSLDAQARNGLAKAAELGLRVLYVQKDAESAWILDKRSKFQQVLADAKAGKFGVLIVDKMDRLSRSEDLAEFMAISVELKRAGVYVVFSQRDYDRDPITGKLTPMGQVMEFLDAWQSSQDQANRRQRSLTGKRHRVHNQQRPIPGSWALYGYRWTDGQKTHLEFDPGDSQRIVRRIWQYFLHGEHPTLVGMAKTLNREGVPTPRVYRGVRPISPPPGVLDVGPRWTAATVRNVLTNPVYWGGNADGLVPAFASSKYSEQALIPAYAPAYVTPEEATRVHARLASNKQHAARNRKYDRETLLHGGLARCGYCGWSLAAYTFKRPRADGSQLTVYRCQRSLLRGTNDCRGVSISAEALDLAVLSVLDEQLNHGDFLRRIFTAWDAYEESALGDVRALERTVQETRQQVDNAIKRVATFSPDDLLAAPLEAHARMLAETLPDLEARLASTRAALDTARGNTALRDELATWFEAWLGGIWMLSRDALREFLFSLHAQVKVYRADDHTPRAQLVIALPTSALVLPPAPTSADGWQFDVDISDAERRVAESRGFVPVRSAAPAASATPAASAADDAAALMQQIEAEMVEQGYGASVAQRRAARTAVGKVPNRRKSAFIF